MKKKLNLLVALLSLLMILFVKVITPVCNHSKSMSSMPMKCHYTSISIVLISIILFVISIEGWRKETSLPFTIIAIGLILFIIPSNSVVGICNNHAMACHSTSISIRAISSLVVISGLSFFFIKDGNKIV